MFFRIFVLNCFLIYEERSEPQMLYQYLCERIPYLSAFIALICGSDENMRGPLFKNGENTGQRVFIKAVGYIKITGVQIQFDSRDRATSLRSQYRHRR
ncbi:MAG: hypothetical protein CR997_06825 [Acidobacteria bacterium]|nr:MAG: hypothetical protein CR997_06825 [Acidobacteriota bacterium]